MCDLAATWHRDPQTDLAAGPPPPPGNPLLSTGVRLKCSTEREQGAGSLGGVTGLNEWKKEHWRIGAGDRHYFDFMVKETEFQ